MSLELIRSKPLAKLADLPLRIYSNPICPYAQRARLIAIAKEIEHEVIEVDLKEKPEWFLKEINPFGLVPVIEHNGHIIRESSISFDYIDEVFGEHKLWPTDPYKKAQGKLILNDFGEKFTTSFYKYYRNAQDENTPQTILKFLKSVEVVIAQYGGPFIMGNQLSAIDLMIWPWFERLPFLFKIATDLKAIYNDDNIPIILKWEQAMKQVEAVKKTSLPIEGFVAFGANMKATGSFDYSLLNIQGLKVYTKV